MRTLIFILCLMVSSGVFSCPKKKWKQTPSGVYYQLFTNDSLKEKPVYGDHIWMHLRKFSPKQKEIFSTRVFDMKNGVEMDYKKPAKESDVTAIFLLMGKGDSAVVRIPARFIDSNGCDKKYYVYHLNLLNFKRKEQYESDRQQQYKQQMNSDSLTVVDYLKIHNLLDASVDTFGNTFFCKQHGSGRRVAVGDTVEIHYVGKLANGVEFDNSYNRKQLLSFVVGKKQVIEGLDKGIRNFYIGDKGLLIIPSRSAYGDREVGRIPQNSVLIFEIEIIK